MKKEEATYAQNNINTTICDILVFRCEEKALPGQYYFSPRAETALSRKTLMVALQSCSAFPGSLQVCLEPESSLRGNPC